MQISGGVSPLTSIVEDHLGLARKQEQETVRAL